MKKAAILLGCAAVAAVLSGCGGSGASGNVSAAASSEAAAAAGESFKNHKVLVAYFSYGENQGLSGKVDANASASIQPLDGEVTGNTGLLARDIQKVTGGTLYSIKVEKPYPASYNDTVNIGKEEQAQKARPALASHIENLGDYDVVFLGFPNWWGDMPMAMYTFLDEYDFSGKTVIPFATSGGSGLSDTVNAIKKEEPNAKVLDGFHVGAESAAKAEPQVAAWLGKIQL